MAHPYYTRAKDLQYRAAGVLPFAVAPAGQVLILLGRERGWGPRSHTLRWKDFGGHREAIDEDAESTAAREFSEETLGLFGGPEVATCSIAASTSTMSARLRSAGGVFRVDAPLRNGGSYCMFVARVAYIDPLLFNLATQENAVTKGVEGAEKCGFAWVEAGRLLAAIEAEEAGSAKSAQEKALKRECKGCTEAAGDAGGGKSEKACQVAAKGTNTKSEVESSGGASANAGVGETVNGGASFRRSVVAVMVKGPKPARTAKCGRPRSKGDHRLLLHSSFVCTLRRAQAGGLMDFLAGACQGGPPSQPIFPAGGTDWEGGPGSVTLKRKEREEKERAGKKRRLSSECLVYWVLHARKIGALEDGLGVGDLGIDEVVGQGRSGESTRQAVAASEDGSRIGVEPGCIGDGQEGLQPQERCRVDVRVIQRSSNIAKASNGMQKRGVESGGREFLDTFPAEQRSTVAGAFHEAARSGEGEPAAVVASVLARAALKVQQLRLTTAPATAPDAFQQSAPVDLPPLRPADSVGARPQYSHSDNPASAAPPVVSARFANRLTTASLVHKDDPLLAALGSAAAPSLVHKIEDAADPQSGFPLVDRNRIDEVGLGVAGRNEAPSWELYARRYALGSSGRETGDGPVEQSNCAKSALFTPGAQAAAAAWAELERQLRGIPPEGALAYARSVIEWGSLGDAEKRRRKKRRRLAVGRR
ncbi:hypothetical protein KFL_004960100 [Klebsormidium nitens]|uniref:Nudix hydrolase domain-containing protein n=1 Tax=Klebsormidium nitens TaxID=105231 RepID=A0A1Y1IE45_KLENI|nr:hypothetical protein KFL_004960100 [Klebsormidium nitens]|eukprot:GAQ89200.1 hypothetical protein KFL_004960100 [Klebsormidium nitens]